MSKDTEEKPKYVMVLDQVYDEDKKKYLERDEQDKMQEVNDYADQGYEMYDFDNKNNFIMILVEE